MISGFKNPQNILPIEELFSGETQVYIKEKVHGVKTRYQSEEYKR